MVCRKGKRLEERMFTSKRHYRWPRCVTCTNRNTVVRHPSTKRIACNTLRLQEQRTEGWSIVLSPSGCLSRVRHRTASDANSLLFSKECWVESEVEERAKQLPSYLFTAFRNGKALGIVIRRYDHRGCSEEFFRKETETGMIRNSSLRSHSYVSSYT